MNPADRWQEGNPHLVTAYSVLSIQMVTGQARPAAATRPAAR